MEVETLIVGQLKTNCYLIYDEESRDAVIVDPGDDAEYIINKIQDLNLKPQFIVATHGHFDHVLAVTELKLAFNIPFLMHKNDLAIYKRTRRTNKYFVGTDADPVLDPDIFLKEGDIINNLRVIETPGHTPGSISLYSNNFVFTGDTLFKEAVGSTEHQYSSPGDLKKSLQKLIDLPKETTVYPGHGDSTTIEEELSLCL